MNNKHLKLNTENKVQIACMTVLAILAIVAGMVVGCGKDPGGGGEVTETAVETEPYNLISGNEMSTVVGVETSGNEVTKTVSEDVVPLSKPFDTAEERMAQKKPDFNEGETIKTVTLGEEAEESLNPSRNNYTNCTYLIKDYAEYSPDFYEFVDFKPLDNDLIFTGTLYELFNPDGTPCYDKVFFPCDKEEWEKLGYTVNVVEDCVIVFDHNDHSDYEEDLADGVLDVKEAVGTVPNLVRENGKGIMEYKVVEGTPKELDGQTVYDGSPIEPGMYGSLLWDPLHYAVWGCHGEYNDSSDEERRAVWIEERDYRLNPVGLTSPNRPFQFNDFTQYLLKDQIPADKELADNVVHE